MPVDGVTPSKSFFEVGSGTHTRSCLYSASFVIAHYLPAINCIWLGCNWFIIAA